MPLVRLQDGPAQWSGVKDAAYILWKASEHRDLVALRDNMAADMCDRSLTVKDIHSLHTGIRGTRRAILVSAHARIFIAFEGSGPNEIDRNLWALGKGPNWWDIPWPVFTDGKQVHSFYRDLWNDMRAATLDALSKAIEDITSKGKAPQEIVVTGFSMGGGISTLAFMDILSHTRSTYGTLSWAQDSALSSLIRHYTFAAVGAADQGYYTILNKVYEQHGVRAWDFVHHDDITRHIHYPAFRAWRGHKYILPDAVVRHCEGKFGPQNHWIAGYLKAAEWMMGNGTDQVKSAYSY